MAVVIKIAQLEDGVDLRPRQLSKYTKAAHQEVGYRWQIDMLPRHFTPAARAIYKHRRRSSKYQKRKIAFAKRRPDLVKMGGLVDNVFSGLFRRLMLKRHQVRAYPSRVTVALMGPSYFRVKPKDARHPDKAAEIKTVTPDEAAQLSKHASSAFERAMQRSRRRKKTNY